MVYRVKDSLYYAVLVEEWDGEQWRKFRVGVSARGRGRRTTCRWSS